MSPKDERPRVWVGHIALPTPDIPKTREFMVQLGMRPIADGDGFAVLELRGGTHLVLTPGEQLASGPAYFDLMVDDLDAAHEECKALGFAPTEIRCRPRIPRFDSAATEPFSSFWVS
jgi:catechol 2,3-dioxygenase-like lactoylglutathione lyase family enzyme